MVTTVHYGKLKISVKSGLRVKTIPNRSLSKTPRISWSFMKDMQPGEHAVIPSSKAVCCWSAVATLNKKHGHKRKKFVCIKHSVKKDTHVLHRVA